MSTPLSLSSTSNSPIARSTILIVEDEAPLRELLQGALTEAGFTVRTAEHGGAALDAVAQEKPDLVVTDLCMPNVDGMELVMQLRRIAASMPVIVISGGMVGNTTDMLRAARLLGARRTLEKPFALQDLVRAVREVIVPRNVQACA
jgi:two-component system, chemotaxis family, chemotaxis protein CheY